MYIHKEGRRILGYAFWIALSISMLVWYLGRYFGVYEAVVVSLSLIWVTWGLVAFFFRIPRRTLPVAPAEVLFSPADGRVTNIQEIEEPECIKGKAIRVSIFLSPLNVHCNYVPISATVEYYKYHAGRFIGAFYDKSSTLNERTTILLATPKHRIVVRQIAGLIARRIACYVQEGQAIQRGEELGFIRFGSRVDVFLPLGTEILVQKNQTVRSKLTQLAVLK